MNHDHRKGRIKSTIWASQTQVYIYLDLLYYYGSPTPPGTGIPLPRFRIPLGTDELVISYGTHNITKAGMEMRR